MAVPSGDFKIVTSPRRGSSCGSAQSRGRWRTSESARRSSGTSGLRDLELIALSHKNYDGDREVGNRLLVAQTLIGGDKHIELVRGEGNKCPIPLGSPAHFWNGANLVVWKFAAKSKRYALIKQNPACANTDSLVSSSTATACLRLTVREVHQEVVERVPFFQGVVESLDRNPRPRQIQLLRS